MFVYRAWIQNQTDNGVKIGAFLLTCCEALNKLLNLFESQFPHL